MPVNLRDDSLGVSSWLSPRNITTIHTTQRSKIFSECSSLRKEDKVFTVKLLRHNFKDFPDSEFSMFYRCLLRTWWHQEDKSLFSQFDKREVSCLASYKGTNYYPDLLEEIGDLLAWLLQPSMWHVKAVLLWTQGWINFSRRYGTFRLLSWNLLIAVHLFRVTGVQAQCVR